MSDNKFILQLKGTQTPKSVVEIKNDKLVAPFVNVPGSSDAVGSIIPDKDSSVVVAKGAENWQLDGGALVPATNLTGNGADFTGEYAVSGSGLWINAVYTFPSTGDPAHPVAEIFNPQTKWVLQLCGKNLQTGNGNKIGFSFIIKIGSSHIMTKTVTVSEQANFFCKRFVLDFSESEQSIIKASGGAKLTVQLLCADDSASATIYNGMTILTALQRRIDASAVSASFANVEEALRDGMLPSDYFSNAEFIDEVEDGEQAYAVFERDGDNVNLAGWTSKDDIATTTQLNDEITARENADLGLQDQIDDLKGLGRFLSVWNCVTGLAETNPPESPYTYNSGDYFLVGTVGATNYKPNGATYTTGVASTTVETGSVQVNDVYIYDGTTWKLQENSQRTVTFSGIQGSPYDNTALSNALNSKVDDVKVNNVSVVTSKIANIDLTNYVTLSTTQAITGTKTFKAEILSWNNITFESAQANPIIRGMSGASYRNMITRTNSASAIDVGNTSDKINLKGSGTRPTYNSNDLAMYSDIPAQVNSDWNANSGVAEILNKPTLGTAAAADTTDFATAAQGAKADTAVQPAAMDDKVDINTMWVPKLDGLTPIATYEFDIASTDYIKFLTATNTYTTNEQVPCAGVIFRITTTGTNISAVADCVVSLNKNLTPGVLVKHYTKSTTSTTTGIKYIRAIRPKAVNNGYGWDFEIQQHNATSRHYKIEVFKTDSAFTWLDTPVVSTYNSDYQTAGSVTLYTTLGYIIYPSLTVSVSGASSASTITSRLTKFLAGTALVSGAAMLASQFAFLGTDKKLYPSTTKTVPIETGFGFYWQTYAYSANKSVSYSYMYQKFAVVDLTNVQHDTLANGDPCYMRCTIDANGNIYSDDYVSNTMSAGYTWYYLGVAGSNTAINLDVINSMFLTLDANGKLTHVNGKEISGGGGSSTLAGLSDVTITSATSGQALTYNGSGWVNSTIYAMQIVDYTA